MSVPRPVHRALRCLLAGVVAAPLAGCRDAPTASPAPPVPVKVTPILQRDVPIYREWLATTVGLVTAQIRPKVNGYLLTQDYQEGRLVKAGDLLFTIDPRPCQNSADQAKGTLAQAQSQRKQAQAQLAENQ